MSFYLFVEREKCVRRMIVLFCCGRWYERRGIRMEMCKDFVTE